MSETVGDRLVGRLRDWEVEQVFGCPGNGIEGIDGIVTAFGRAGDRPRFVRTGHEEMAALAAVGYAKVGDRVGVCLATSGSGMVPLLDGLHDARFDRVPVLAIIGRTDRGALVAGDRQEADLRALFTDLVEVDVAEKLPDAVDRAIGVALGQRAPAALIVPADGWDRVAEHAVPSNPPGREPSTMLPAERDVRRAADVLNAGDRVAILAGQGARGAASQLVELAELTGAGVAKTLLGKDVLSDELPFVTGPIGPLGTRPSHELLRDCDTLLIVGSGMPDDRFQPEPDKVRRLRIDADGPRHPTEVDLGGDAGHTLRALLPLVERRTDRAWRATIEENVAGWWRTMRRQAMSDADPLSPMRVVAELSERIPDDAIVTVDPGSAANWYARLLRMRGRIRGSLSGTLASTGCAVPYAIGAKFAHPDRPVVALVGDGAGPSELMAVAECRDGWADQRLVVCVLHDDDRASGSEAAKTFGLNGIAVDTADGIGAAWELALSAARPTVLDVRCDPNVPPIPTYERRGGADR